MPHPANFRDLWIHFLAIALFSVLLVAAAIGLFNLAASAATSPGLGTAASFAVLAGERITNVPTSDITGDVGLSPGTGAAIGLTCAEVTGTIYQVDAAGPLCFVTNPGLLTTAKADLTTAFNNLTAGENATCTVTFAGELELSGLTLVPGVYCAGTFQLSGPLPLVLDDTDAPDGVWIFRSESTLNSTGGGLASVEFLTGTASPCNVWWRVPSSATIGSGTDFIGNILALASISMGTGATLQGRALAQVGEVTLDSNTINADECLPPTGPEATATQAAAATATQAAAATATRAAAATATQAAAATATQAAAATATRAAGAGNPLVDISNTNTNVSDNENSNNLINDNVNDNLNTNENAQDQNNEQDQSNQNNQEVNVDSSPSVRISGPAQGQRPSRVEIPQPSRADAPQPTGQVQPPKIQPPSTGSGGQPPAGDGATQSSLFWLLPLGAAIAAGAGATVGLTYLRARK